jgi:hypothetical protein
VWCRHLWCRHLGCRRVGCRRVGRRLLWRRRRRAAAVSAMLSIGQRRCGRGQEKKESRERREEACREDTSERTAPLRRRASAGRAVVSCCAAPYCGPRHGGSSFSLERGCVLSHKIRVGHTGLSPPAAASRSVRRWTAGIVIKVCIERVQLLIDLRIAVQQLQIMHGSGFLRGWRRCAMLHPDRCAAAQHQ